MMSSSVVRLAAIFFARNGLRFRKRLSEHLIQRCQNTRRKLRRDAVSLVCGEDLSKGVDDVVLHVGSHGFSSRSVATW